MGGLHLPGSVECLHLDSCILFNETWGFVNDGESLLTYKRL